MNLANWLDSTARTRPDAPALLTGTSLRANYRQFAQSASALAVLLRQRYAVRPGDRVALYMANRVEYLVLMYAIWWMGAVVVPVNYRLHTKEALWIAGDAQARLILTDTGNALSQADLPPGCTEAGVDALDFAWFKHGAGAAPDKPATLPGDALAWLFYTSGTTGRPKGVMLSHGNLMAMALCYMMDVDDVCPDMASVYAAPLSHGAGLYNLVFVRMGARHVVPDSRGFDSSELTDLALRLRHTTFFAAPTMVKRLVTHARKAGYNGDGIQCIVIGGAPMYAADLVEALDVLGPRFAQIYGQGEAPMTLTAMRRDRISALYAAPPHPDREHRLASVGTAHSCIDLRVVDDELDDLPAGTPGEIIARGPVIMQGYWRNPQASGQTLVDGWLRTGDIGYLDDAGFLTLTDRSKDVIISGGANVYPREVEEVLARHPGIFEVAVVGAAHPDWGEEVVAFVVSQDGKPMDTDGLDAWCQTELASFKKPKRYLFCNELPKNSYGKILKTDLRKQALPVA